MELSGGGIIVRRSGRFAQQFAQLLAVIAARSQLRAVLQDDDVIAVKPGLQLFDTIEIDDDRAVDAEKFVGIEFGSQSGDRFAQQMSFPAGVYPHVIGGGFDPVDLIRAQEKDAPARFDHQPI